MDVFSRRQLLVVLVIIITQLTLGCHAAPLEMTYKNPNEDCPEDYYEGEYPDICVPCKDTCYASMDYFTELNCHHLCPGWFHRLATTEVPTSTERGVSLSVILPCAIFPSLSLIGGLIYLLLRCTGGLNRCSRRNGTMTKLPIQVSELEQTVYVPDVENDEAFAS